MKERKASSINDNNKNTEELLENILDNLKAAKDGVKKAKANVENTNLKDSELTKNLQTAIETVQYTIPSFETVLENYTDIKNLILDPVNEELKNSSKTGKFGVWISVISLIFAIVFFVLGGTNISINDTTKQKPLKNEGATEKLISDALGKGNGLNNKIRVIKSRIISDSKLSALNKELYSLNIDEKDVFHITNAAILQLYIDLKIVSTNYEKDLLEGIITSANYLLENKNLKTSQQTEIKWIMSEAFYLSEQLEKAKIEYDTLVNMDFNMSVLDIEGNQETNLIKIIETRKKKITDKELKDNTRIVLINSSIDRHKSLAKDASELLVKDGFQEFNIILTDEKSEKFRVSLVYAYYKDNKHVDALDKVLETIYPKKFPDKRKFDITRVSKSINPRAKEMVNRHNADIVIRMPNPNF